MIEPLNTILKLYEVPNKLIDKRHDKLLDYECARSNYEKIKDKNLYKTASVGLIKIYWLGLSLLNFRLKIIYMKCRKTTKR